MKTMFVCEECNRENCDGCRYLATVRRNQRNVLAALALTLCIMVVLSTILIATLLSFCK